MSLRSILASEGLIVTAGLSDKAQLAVMKKYKHPSLKSTRTSPGCQHRLPRV